MKLINKKKSMKYSKINVKKIQIALKYQCVHLLIKLNMRNQKILMSKKIKSHSKNGEQKMKIWYTNHTVLRNNTTSHLKTKCVTKTQISVSE